MLFAFEIKDEAFDISQHCDPNNMIITLFIEGIHYIYMS